MKKKLLGLVAGLVCAAIVSVAYAAGLWTGFPPATTITGLEVTGFDTLLPQGLNPQTEQISTAQLIGAAVSAQLNSSTAANTTSFTATTAQVTPPPVKVLILNGTLAGAATITTPTAAAWIAALPASFLTQAQQQYTLVIQNASSGAFAWTVAGGTNVTVSGTATINQGAISTWTVTVNQSAGTITLTRVS